jgi:hypothetical protein
MHFIFGEKEKILIGEKVKNGKILTTTKNSVIFSMLSSSCHLQ